MSKSSNLKEISSGKRSVFKTTDYRHNIGKWKIIRD